MAASCHKAVQARLWSQFFKDPSLWIDNRKTKISVTDPDFTHKYTYQPLWLDSRLNPSWVYDRLTSAKVEQHLLTPVQFDGLQVPSSIATLESKETCKEIFKSKLHALQPQDDAQAAALQPRCDNPGCLQKSAASTGCSSKLRLSRFVTSLLAYQQKHIQYTSFRDKDLGIYSYEDSHNCKKISYGKLQNLLEKQENKEDFDYALQLQHYACESGIDVQLSLENLVWALIEDGCINDAQKLFDRLESQCESLWNALITGYAKRGEPQQALNLYKKLQDSGSAHLSAPVALVLLKACTELNNIAIGECIHAKLNEGLVEKDVYVGCCLIHMYAKCGNLDKAQEVFDNLQVQNAATWNALVSGYAEHGFIDKALAYYKQMDHNGIPPDAITLVCSLKAYGNKGDAGSAREVHAEILKKGLLEGDSFLSSCLVDAYAKCGSLVEAQVVFQKLPARNIVSWNAMINRFSEYGYSEMAIQWFEQMQCDDIPPDAVTLTSSLKACASMGDGIRSQEIHSYIVKVGIWDHDVFFGSRLVDVYAKCILITDMHYVFKSFEVRDVVLWNAFISGLLELGLYEGALKSFDQMWHEGLCPNAGTYIALLKACISLGGPFHGRCIHIEIVKQGLLELDAHVGSILVDAYAKCGLCMEAQSVFETSPARDVVSWNALLAGYAEYMLDEEVLQHFELMKFEGIAPDAITFSCTLRACSSLGAINEGHELHREIVKRGMKDGEVENALIDMYSKCCALADAQHVFEHLPMPSVVPLNTIISGYIESGYEEKVLYFYKHELREPATADAVTLICGLKACGNLKAVTTAQEIHREAVCKGLEEDILFRNTLVDIYSRCGLLTEAKKTLHELETPDVVAWTALLSGYVEHGYADEALYYFEKMLEKGIPCDDVLLTCILTVFGKEHVMSKGRSLHTEAVGRGILDRANSVGNGFLAMYTRCGALGDAQKVFNSLPYRDSVSWNTLISGYVEYGCIEDALGLFKQMSHDGVTSNISLLICTLKACSCMEAADRGKETHSEIVEKGLEAQLLVGNTLIDMYVKCGALPAAKYAFDKLHIKDLVSWNTLLTGYSQHGRSEAVIHIFGKMRTEGMQADHVTFSCVLTACSHSGLVDAGQMYLEVVMRDDGVIPCLEHFTCTVDLLGRAGKIDKAMAMICGMPCHPNIVTWRSALGACQRWGNLDIGQFIFENAVALDDKDAGAYVCMCNLYENI